MKNTINKLGAVVNELEGLGYGVYFTEGSNTIEVVNDNHTLEVDVHSKYDTELCATELEIYELEELVFCINDKEYVTDDLQEICNQIEEGFEMTVYQAEQLKEIVQEVASQFNELEEYEYYDRDEMNYLLQEMPIQPLDMLDKIHFGDVKWNHDLFRLDVYENLEGIKYDDYLELLKNNSTEIIECYERLLAEGEISQLF